jgi:hypothetical protein
MRGPLVVQASRLHSEAAETAAPQLGFMPESAVFGIQIVIPTFVAP